MMSLIKSSLLSISSPLPSIFHCESCLCNKSQRLPFGDSTLSSNGPLDLIYTDVWGPSPIASVDGSYYYVIFVDHYTKYIWFYPMRLKSDVFAIFRGYKLLVEKYFKRPITTIYVTPCLFRYAIYLFSRQICMQLRDYMLFMCYYMHA